MQLPKQVDQKSLATSHQEFPRRKHNRAFPLLPSRLAFLISPSPVRDLTCGGLTFCLAFIAFDCSRANHLGDTPFSFFPPPRELGLLSKRGRVVGVGCGQLQSRLSVD